MTALEKVMNMSSQIQTTDTGLERAYSLIEKQQKLAEQQQKFQNYAQLARTGVDVYNIATGKDLIPLKFKGTSFTSMPVGKGTLGGVGTAGMLGYGVSGVLGGSKKQQTGAGAGSAIGMAVGGPVGGVVGGVIGHVIGCFSPDTFITMVNGSKKKIIDIELKDNVAAGGSVFAYGKFLINDLYDYKGIKVSGSHMVYENQKWLNIRDSKSAKSLGNDEYVVYTLGTQNRRILINNILFTDYFGDDEQQKMAS